VRDEEAVNAAVALVEEALAPYDALPHWGKVLSGRGVGKRYERFGEFVRLRERVDPGRKFVNGWLGEVVLGI
jgi:xylitol oxidase